VESRHEWPEDWWVMSAPGLGRLVAMLVKSFDEVLGPVEVDGAIRLRPIVSVDDLPIGVADEQETAAYRLRRTGTKLRFSYGVGPDSLKALVYPPRSPVWTMRRRDGSLVVEPALHGTASRAVVGARACDVRGLRVLEHTQTGGPHADPAFVADRDGLFIVAVDCTFPSPTCFCDTAGHGPALHHGYDIAMTELEGERGARYVLRAGTDRGREFVERLHLMEAPDKLVRQADLELRYAAREQIRELPSNAARVSRLVEHPHWDDVADRCLTCGNCTAVCPTCFCTDVEDQIALDGETATRVRVWDTCFSMEYSRLGASPHRATARDRYRQWLSHKLGTWHDQFGESGCVGCGRCITWCPVGIDITAEVEALAEPIGARS
jgi:ferredoxin